MDLQAIFLGKGLPPSIGAMVDLSRIYVKNGFEEEGIVLLQEAISLDPYNRYFLLVAGDIYRDLNNCESAVKYYQDAATLEPHDGLPEQKILDCENK